ncbi:MAG: TlyA family RNA methyltransferase [Clostridiales bacterium]|nr:TlyA family RNA methyltransferase [Clostridiales bacterium]
MRIDLYLKDKFGSRNKAANAVSEGLVLVNGKTVPASYEVKDGDDIAFLAPEVSFVSAGGYKLQKALKDFDFSVKDGIFADIGASTGGFTDCLLQNGAKKVYCIDVGESQLDESLKDKNIVIIDNFNARNLTRDTFEENLSGAVIDVSFISLTYILGAVSGVLEDGASVLALIKPQFECGTHKVGKNGIVRELSQRKKIITKICEYAKSVNLAPVEITNAPVIKGKNTEYIIRLVKSGRALDTELIVDSVSV